jgi:NifB/MoaA-like Fe-S oxidoreductase
MSKILDPNQSYTFSKFFELNASSDKFVAEFGYKLVRARLNLPQYAGDLDRLDDLKGRIEELLPYVELSSETARREVIVSKVVSDLVH